MTGSTSPLPGQGTHIRTDILQALDRLIAQGLADSSDRQRNLLRYLVTEEVEGRGDRLKAFSIATDVFGRGADFDAQQDSIVRVEIGRLRKSLELYYATAGRADAIRIAIDKGQYRPTFDMREPFAARPARRRRRLWIRLAAVLVVLALAAAGAFYLWPARKPVARNGVRIAVAPFALSADREGQTYIGVGLRAELTALLSDYDWLSVFPIGKTIDVVSGEKPANWDVDYLVKANVQISGDTMTVAPLLLDGKTGAVRWSGRYETLFKANEVIAMQRDIATRIAADVGQPFGAVADLERTRAASGTFDGDDQFRCYLRALQYWTSYRRADFDQALQCARRGGASPSAEPNIRSILALLDLDASRFGLDPRPREQLFAEANDLATDAYNRNEKGGLPRLARYSVALCRDELDTFRRVALAVARDNPNNPVALADVGAKLALGADDWAQGLELVSRAKTLSSNMPIWLDIAGTVDALRRHASVPGDDLHAAAMDSSHPSLLLVDLALQAERRNVEGARAVFERLAAIGYGEAAAIEALLEGQCWSASVKGVLRPLLAAAARER